MQIGGSSIPDRVPDPTTTDPGAQTSGPGFDRLIAAAQAEADRRRAIAEKSGASADQFTEQSWFAIVKAHGAEIGLGAVAGAITKDSHGQFTVIDPALRAKVVNYRNDPLVRSVMAVKRASDGKAVLNVELGRQPSDAEMRAAEAIGAKAAAKLILTRQSTPNASAAIVSPDAATANRALFYRPDGSPQTVNEVLVKLMKPADTTQADRLAAGRAVLSGTAPVAATANPAAPAVQGQGLTPAMAANLRARNAVVAATAPAAPAPRQKVQRPPDLALVGGTIGNLSMPGKSNGVTAPTGGKISGWRAQMAGEVTHQIEHPESVVTNAPSKVTIPAPDPSHHAPINQYVNGTLAAAVIPTATAQPQVQPVSPPTQLLGARLAPASPISQLPISQPPSPVAFVPPTQSAAPVPATMALPLLVAATPMAPTSALPLLPIDDAAGPMVLAPQSASAPTSPVVTSVEPMQPPVMPLVVRPSRYGPTANALTPNMPTRVLGYAAASPLLQTQAISDASSAGIRPSRYYASTVQQIASLARAQPQPSPTPQSVAPAFGQPVAFQPVAVQPALGPDGVPILPSVPDRSGLPPLTASEALQPAGVGPTGQTTQTALLDGTKPLDLAPTVPAPVAAPAAAQPAHARPPRPRLTPPSRF